MFQYILKRLLVYIPTLFAVSLILFFLSHSNANNNISRYLEMEGIGLMVEPESEEYEELYMNKARQIGAHLPMFYWSIQPSNYPEERIIFPTKDEEELVRSLLRSGYQWDFIKPYLKEKKNFSNESVLNWDEPKAVLGSLTNQHSSLVKVVKDLIASKAAFHFPRIDFHGSENQFHHWIFKVLQFNFGESVVDGKRVNRKITKALPWTLVISFSSLFLVILFSVPFGVYLAKNKGKRIDRMWTNLSFVIYSIPVFWLATILVVFFTTPYYGSFMDIFPSIGVKIKSSNQSIMTYIQDNIPRLILPVLCMTLHSISYAAMQTKSSMTNQLAKAYIKTASAKGQATKKILWNHAFKNALLPIVTMFLMAIPAALAGSVIIEVIFNIPGMGRLLYDSILSADWNVVYAIVLLVAIVSLIVYLIGDVVYSSFDPKVDF